MYEEEHVLRNYYKIDLKKLNISAETQNLKLKCK